MVVKIVGVDIETTGLDVNKGHRIIEIAMLECTLEFNGDQLSSFKSGQEYDVFVNPQRAIDAAAQRVHGISVADLVGCKVWEEIAEEVNNKIETADVLVAHNAAFDIPFIYSELSRVGQRLHDRKVYCTMENSIWATDLNKKPNLGELCFATNVDFDASAAHSAIYDVKVMMEALIQSIKLGFFDRDALKPQDYLQIA